MPQDREPVRVPASRLDRDLDIVGIPSGRMEHGRVDPTLAHLLQAILGAVAGDLPVLPGRRALRPDKDLRVDDQHDGPPSRFRSGPVMLRDVGRLRIVTRAAAPRAGRAQPRRIKLGTGVVPVPDRNPLMVANRIIQLDHMALAKAGVGRVMFGAGPRAPDLGRDDARHRSDGPARPHYGRARNHPVPVPRRDRHRQDRLVHPRKRPRPPLALYAALPRDRGGECGDAVGRLGLGMSCLAASMPAGFDALDTNWHVAQ